MKRAAATTALALLLAACGGGGSDESAVASDPGPIATAPAPAVPAPAPGSEAPTSPPAATPAPTPVAPPPAEPPAPNPPARPPAPETPDAPPPAEEDSGQPDPDSPAAEQSAEYVLLCGRTGILEPLRFVVTGPGYPWTTLRVESAGEQYVAGRPDYQLDPAPSYAKSFIDDEDGSLAYNGRLQIRDDGYTRHVTTEEVQQVSYIFEAGRLVRAGAGRDWPGILGRIHCGTQ